MNNRDLADHMLDLALINYANDGAVYPAFLAIGGEQNYSVGVPFENVDVPEEMATVVMAFVNVVRPTKIVCVFEAWMKAFPTAEGLDLRHGDLQKAHEAGDAEVHTGINVVSFDVVGSWEAARMVTLDVDDPQAERHYAENPQGRFPDLMRRARLAINKPPLLTVEEMLAAGKAANAFWAFSIDFAA